MGHVSLQFPEISLCVGEEFCKEIQVTNADENNPRSDPLSEPTEPESIADDEQDDDADNGIDLSGFEGENIRTCLAEKLDVPCITSNQTPCADKQQTQDKVLNKFR